MHACGVQYQRDTLWPEGREARDRAVLVVVDQRRPCQFGSTAVGMAS
jgi:hypothetical protein